MADYSVDVNQSGALGVISTLLGLDKIKTDSTVHVPEPVRGDATVHVPEAVRGDATVHVPEAVRGDATVHVPEPLTVKSTLDSTVDIRPLAVDSCTRVVLGPLPPTRVRSPWEQRLSVTLFGVELFALAVSGEYRTYVESLPAEPAVLGDVEEASTLDRSGGGRRPGGGRRSGGGRQPGRPPPGMGAGPGLEIRLGR